MCENSSRVKLNAHDAPEIMDCSKSIYAMTIQVFSTFHRIDAIGEHGALCHLAAKDFPIVIGEEGQAY